MPPIDLNTAVREIYQIVDQRRRRNELLRSPFFFIVGSGVSVPFIPVASEIEEQCRQEAQRYDDTAPPQLRPGMESYSYWLGKAYPSPEELQTYLRGLMEDKPISKANLRLAHLLLDGKIARTLFTPNFDDMATKALELFGKRPLVCDHPLTGGRIRIESEDIQVIHVHGSYSFYDHCNLRQEIADRSGYGPMSVLLDQSLRDHSPLVLGYSGWDCDILMSALHRRLVAGKLGTPAFWFCHTRESMDSLPAWLTGSSDVKFVMPDEPDKAVAIRANEQRLEPTTLAAPSPQDVGGEGDASASSVTLSANRVLDALVRQFQPQLPPLIQNPLRFYTEHLHRLIGTSDPEGETDAYYGFHKLIARVEKARDAETVEKPDPLQSFREAMSKAEYRQAIRLANETDLDKLPRTERVVLASALFDAAIGLDDNSSDETGAYDLIVGIVDTLTDESDPPLQRLVSKTLFNKGFALRTLNKNEEAIAAYDEIVRRFADESELLLRGRVAKALVNKGFILWTLDRGEEAIKVFDEVVDRFAKAPESALHEQVAKALVNKGATLAIRGRGDEAIATYDEVLRRFVDATDPAVRALTAQALYYKGGVLDSLNKHEEAIETYNEVTRRFADGPESAARVHVAKALCNKGFALGNLGRNDEAITAYDEVVRRFSDAAEPAQREEVAKALRNKGQSLMTLNRHDEAIAVFDEVARRFADATEPPLREQVAGALANKGYALEAADRDSAIATFEDLISRFEGAPETEIMELLSWTRQRLGELRNEGAGDEQTP